jgi:hypothetical protein
MSVDGGRGDGAVTEKNLHNPEVDIALKEPRGVAVP